MLKKNKSMSCLKIESFTLWPVWAPTWAMPAPIRPPPMTTNSLMLACKTVEVDRERSESLEINAMISNQFSTRTPKVDADSSSQCAPCHNISCLQLLRKLLIQITKPLSIAILFIFPILKPLIKSFTSFANSFNLFYKSLI